MTKNSVNNRALTVTKAGLKDMSFVNYPFEQILRESDGDAWIQEIDTLLEEGNFNPSQSDIAEVPKGKGAVRPGTILTIPDQYAYAKLIDDIYPALSETLAWSQETVDFAYILRENPEDDFWFKDQYEGWKKFKEKSLEAIQQETAFVIITDITGCYENIDHRLLLSDLRQIGVGEGVVDQLRKMLSKWSLTQTKGIPQGSFPSHLLAKLYLNSIDHELIDKGYRHTRYVDDIRIFCKSMSEAKLALIELSAMLRAKGLNLQSAKTSILRADAAANEIDKNAALIEAVDAKYKKIIDVIEIDEPPYVIEIHQNTAIPNTEQLELIEDAFRNFFIDGEEKEFNKSLFHYLLNKLGMAQSDFAVIYALNILEKHPEETKFILKYLSRISPKTMISDYLIGFINEPTSVYDYQIFEILGWLHEKKLRSNDSCEFARSVAFDQNRPDYLRTLAKQILGDLGTATDLHRIQDSFARAASTTEKEGIICSLRKMEKSRRNSFLNEIGRLNPELSTACKFAKVD